MRTAVLLNQTLTAPTPINIRGIPEIDPALSGSSKNRLRPGIVQRAKITPQLPAAEADFRNIKAAFPQLPLFQVLNPRFLS
jgi:hypothetical protein